MDNVTHALFGAALGHAACARRLGRQALVWGAVANNVPDLDLLASLTGPLGEWRCHRGFTHAFWFGPLAGALLGGLAWRAHRRRRPDAALAPWVVLFVLGLTTHPLMDMTTSWGTQWLAPFSRRRIALDALPIIDLFYTGLLLLGAAVAIAARGARWRTVTAAVLLASTGWMAYGLVLNRRAEAMAARQLEMEGIRAAQVRAYPVLLQPWLRRIVARSGGEVRVGLLSLWHPSPVEWGRFVEERHPLITAARRVEEARLFEWFAMAETAARVHMSAEGPVVEFEDLRFGYGARPEQGLWGVRVPVDGAGLPRGPVTRFNRRPSDLGATLTRLWQATFGGR